VIRRLRSEQSGFTLIEVLVACTVGSVVMLALFGLADAAQHASVRIDRRSDSAQRGRPAVEQMIQLLRSAVCLKATTSTLPIASATDTSVQFYAQVATGTSAVGWTNAFNPSRYTLKLVGSTLSVDTTLNTATYPTFTAGATTNRVLSGGVRQTGAAPIFRYYAYDSSGNLDPYNGTAPLTTPLSAADLLKVAVIRITFTIKPTGSAAAASDSDSSFDEIVRLRLVDPQAPNPQNGAVCRA
jgi:prepilin-type N-terminal cleavage/methylation domain-containing protein